MLMKKFYSTILALAAVLFCSSAWATPVNFTIDHADRVTLSINYQEVGPLQDGLNTFDVNIGEYGTSFNIVAKNGFSLESCVNGEGTAYSIYGDEVYGTIRNEEIYQNWTITTGNYADLRTDSITVTVDDASRVRMQLSSTQFEVPLVNGTQTVKFIPDRENNLYISPAKGPIYQVTLNGQVQKAEYNYYTISVANGDSLNITAAFPDKDCTVNITEKGDAGFISTVKVDEEAVATPLSFTAKAGQSVEITGNTANYKFEKMVVDGDTITSFYGSYSFTLTDNVDIEVWATKYGTYKTYIVVDDPENVRFYKGYYTTEENRLAVNPGINEFEFPETGNGQKITINKTDRGNITSVKLNGEEQTNYEWSGINLTANDTLTVTTEKIVRDKAFMFYIAGQIKGNYFSITRAVENNQLRSDISSDIKLGYNKVEFNDNENPFGLNWYMEGYGGSFYINDTPATPEYEGETSFKFSVAEGDVLKLFMCDTPERYTLTFDVDAASGAVVTRDYVTTLTDLGTPSEAFAGTIYSVTVPEGYKATLGDTELTLDADGKAEFTPEADATLTVTSTTGVEDVTVDNQAVHTVYNLQGMRVEQSTELHSLPAGVYVVGGKKVLVK